MHVIWHDHEVAHPIAVAIKVQQRVCYDLRQFGPLQHTHTKAFVELRFTTTVKVEIELVSLRVSEHRQQLGPVLIVVVRSANQRRL